MHKKRRGKIGSGDEENTKKIRAAKGGRERRRGICVAVSTEENVRGEFLLSYSRGF